MTVKTKIVLWILIALAIVGAVGIAWFVREAVAQQAAEIFSFYF